MAEQFDPRVIFHNEKKGNTVSLTVRETDIAMLNNGSSIGLDFSYEEIDIDQYGFVKYPSKENIEEKIKNVGNTGDIEIPVLLNPLYQGIIWSGICKASPFKVNQGNYTHFKTKWCLTINGVKKEYEVDTGDLTYYFILKEDQEVTEASLYVEYFYRNNDTQEESSIKSLPKTVKFSPLYCSVGGTPSYKYYSYNSKERFEVIFNKNNIFISSDNDNLEHYGTLFRLKKEGQDSYIEEVTEEQILTNTDDTWTPVYKDDGVTYDTNNSSFTVRPNDKYGYTFGGTKKTLLDKNTNYILEVKIYANLKSDTDIKIKSEWRSFTYKISTDGIVPTIELIHPGTTTGLGNYKNFQISLGASTIDTFRHVSTIVEVSTTPDFSNIILKKEAFKTGDTYYDLSTDELPNAYVTYNNNVEVNDFVRDNPNTDLTSVIFLTTNPIIK